jgi:hypothetical protein
MKHSKVIIVFYILLILSLSACVEKNPRHAAPPITTEEDAISYSENIIEVNDFVQKHPDAVANAWWNGDTWIVVWKKTKIGTPETLYVYIEAKTGNVTRVERIY